MGRVSSRFAVSRLAGMMSLGVVLGATVLGCSDDKVEGTTAGAGGASAGTAGSATVAGAGTAGTTTQGGSSGAAGSGAGGGASGSGGSAAGASCDSPGLTWKTARKTWYTSYPDPNSEECIKFNGCTWAGQFAACPDKKTEDWVSKHNIVAAFPNFEQLKLHDLCLKSGDKTLVVTVYDTCADSDCSGCCTQNQADNDALIDLESYTNQRWGVEDGVIQWADLGPTQGAGCQ